VTNAKWKIEDAAKVISGFTTEGESLNTGSKNGLWTKVQQECSLHVLFFCCACHRSSLAFKSFQECRRGKQNTAVVQKRGILEKNAAIFYYKFYTQNLELDVTFKAHLSV